MDKIIRDKKGRIIKGVAQDTNKNGTAGRPCEFCANKNKFLKITEDYFKKCYESNPQGIPYLEELSLLLDSDINTITDWRNKKDKKENYEHPEFNRATARMNTLQRLKLLHRTIGRYNPTGAMFQLRVNHKMIETTKQIQSGDSDNPVKYEIEIVEDKPKKDEV